MPTKDCAGKLDNIEQRYLDLKHIRIILHYPHGHSRILANDRGRPLSLPTTVDSSFEW